jgi:hypothetical protein
MSMTSIYPENFFNVPHPTAPYMNIQFRSKSTKDDKGNVTPDTDITNPDIWEEITVDPNNFLNNATIEDNGGVQRLNLSLFDQNYSRLENIVMKAMTIPILQNQLAQNKNWKTDTEYVEFAIDMKSATNLRVRFGYSEIKFDDHFYVDASDRSDNEYLKRANDKKTILRSPWLYFQILKLKLNVMAEGLQVELEAISDFGIFLDKAKFLSYYAELSGPPKGIITGIGDKIAKVTNKDLMFIIEDDPLAYPTAQEPDPKKAEINGIFLGGEPKYRIDEKTKERQFVLDYKPIRQVLDEICAKVAPAIYDKNANQLSIPKDSTGDGIEKDSEKEDDLMRYSYSVGISKGPGGQKRTVVRFYYQNKQKQFNDQTNVRVYFRGEMGNSIVKNLTIESSSDFASMNMPVAIDGQKEGTKVLISTTDNDVGADPIDVDWRQKKIKEISKYIQAQTFDGMFVSDVKQMKDTKQTTEGQNEKDAGFQYMRNLIMNLNEQVFSGTLEIPGDPFYLFDGEVKPFVYLIKVLVRNPVYYDKLEGESDYSLKGGQTSYISGYYVIKKITHRIDTSGFSTTLDIMKWPKIVKEDEKSGQSGGGTTTKVENK